MNKYFIRHLDSTVELWSTIRGYRPGQGEETLLELSGFIEEFDYADDLADGIIAQEWDLLYTGEFHFFNGGPYFFYTNERNKHR